MKKTNTSFSIKNWSEDDRPREKLLRKGNLALSDAELMAILIGSGNRNESAVALSKRILGSVNHDLGALGKSSINDLLPFKGIGEAKAVAIVAALELGKRQKNQGSKKQVKIVSSQSVFELMRPLIGDLPHEEFWVVYVNNANMVLDTKQLSKGGITGTLVDVRIAFKQALQLGAVAIIVAHNHPSGTLKPSKADVTITQKLKTAGEGLDIKLLDHLIITEKAYFSFADSTML